MVYVQRKGHPQLWVPIEKLPSGGSKFSSKGAGLSESIEVDGLAVKVSSQLWRNWRAPKAQASWGVMFPTENFFI